MFDLFRKRVLVLGLGLSGEAAAELLLREGAVVTVIDDGESPELMERAGRLRAKGVFVALGERGRDIPERCELLVMSPGIPPEHPVIRRSGERGVPILGEVELAYRFLPGRLIAVTGTNGKTTTVSLLTGIFRRAGLPAVAGGNNGYPLSRVVLDGGDRSPVVAEISSFQLERIDLFRPEISVLLNITPDHLDRYREMANYRSAKLRLFRNQGSGDRAVIPERLRSLLTAVVPPEVEMVTWGGEGGMVRREEGALWLNRAGQRERICGEDEIPLRGKHNRENVMAAATVALICGVPVLAIREAVCSFRGLPHRLEYLGEVSGVHFYNDSKATNPGAVAAALGSFDRPVIWLAGGSEKGLDFSLLKPRLSKSVKLALLIGESREKLRRLVEGVIPFQMASSLEEVVSIASRRAEPGDSVLLSPGCASFDMFTNYRERGEIFKDLVRKLKE